MQTMHAGNQIIDATSRHPRDVKGFVHSLRACKTFFGVYAATLATDNDIGHSSTITDHLQRFSHVLGVKDQYKAS